MRGVRAYMLQTALQIAGDPAATVVRSTLVAAVALVLKRGWQDEPWELRAQFLQASVCSKQVCICAGYIKFMCLYDHLQ